MARRRGRRRKKGGRSKCYYKFRGRYVTAGQRSRLKRKSRRKSRRRSHRKSR